MNDANWDRLLRRDRLCDSAHAAETSRDSFQKDIDRITFSPGFRRLARKTQVHPLEEHDHIHTRLTHSLEVASVGRSLGARAGRVIDKMCSLPDDVTPNDVGRIVQAACLAHDIGNPPFGHSGEAAVRAWFRTGAGEEVTNAIGEPEQVADFLNFEGNAQGFRAITKLEDRPFEGGLRLTYATLGAYMKYPFQASSPLAKNTGKCGYYYGEAEIASDVAKALGLTQTDESFVKHPLAYLTEAADDLCYALIDLEDAVELQMLSYDEVEAVLLPALPEGMSIAAFRQSISGMSSLVKLSRLRNLAFDSLVFDIVDAFGTCQDEIISGTFDSSLVDMANKRTRSTIGAAKELARERVFTAPRKTRIEIGAYAVLSTLLGAFSTATLELYRTSQGEESFKTKRVLDLMGSNQPRREWGLHGMMSRVMDYIAGMTDNFASRLARDLQGVVS